MNQSQIIVGDLVVLAQTQPEVGAAPATAPAGGQPINAVGVPGSPTPATDPAGQPLSGGSGQGAAGGSNMFIWLIGAMVVMMLLTSLMSGRKEKKKREQLMSSLKKHDKVQMLGGIVGTVVEMNDTEVVLRVEEGRIRFARSAVQHILTESKAKTEVALAEPKSEGKAAAV